ncbi:MAG: hypothetical protein HOV81_43840 [Kofleriaceae bacterium]|nr:hypothetical protein [Kofleriaceae bacterium]
MVELFENIDVLRQKAIYLSSLSLAGVGFGARGREIPRDAIVEVSGSPLVARSSTGTNISPTYWDAADNIVPFDQVIDSVLDADGMIHLEPKVSFKLVGGRVMGFSLYGSHLAALGHPRTYDDLVGLFGVPDRERERVTFGDLMGYDLYYETARKQVCWDALDHRVYLVCLGDYPF